MSLPRPFFLGLLLFAAFALRAQTDTIQPPYKRFPHLPAFKLLLGDSATFYTKDALPKNKPVLVMLFSPECSHCQHTAEEIVQHKEALKNIQIIMATLHPISQMNAFVETYGLKDLSNVIVGKDVYFILPPFYSIQNLPYMAFYKKNGALIRTVDGALPMEKVLELFKRSAR
jgi:thioredoxin-related protein